MQNMKIVQESVRKAQEARPATGGPERVAGHNPLAGGLMEGTEDVDEGIKARTEQIRKLMSRF